LGLLRKMVMISALLLGEAGTVMVAIMNITDKVCVIAALRVQQRVGGEQSHSIVSIHACRK